MIPNNIETPIANAKVNSIISNTLAKKFLIPGRKEEDVVLPEKTASRSIFPYPDKNMILNIDMNKTASNILPMPAR